MDRLTTVSACIEWAARLAAPAVCALIAIASAVTAAITLAHGHVTAAVVLTLGAALTCLLASVLAVKAVRRLRSGPTTPPGENL